MSKLIVAQSIPCLPEDSITPFTFACQLFSGRQVRDRFNVLNEYSDFNWIDTVDPIPEPKDTPLKELMDKRAQDFLGKKVVTQWSGGVDSTSIVLALIKNGIHKDDLLILHDDGSVQENPKLYHFLKDNEYNIKEVKHWRKELGSVDTDVITNGWCADQLFGSIFFHEAYAQYNFEPVKFLSSVTGPFGPKLTEEQAKEFAQVYKDAAKKLFNLDLNIAAELGWYINFTMKWTWVSTFNELYLLGTKNKNKTDCFFNTDYFQSWSIFNYPNIAKHNIYGEDARYYKRELKEYCYEVFPDDEFLLKKTKFPSWNGALSHTEEDEFRLTFKLDDGYRIYSVPYDSIGNIAYPFQGKFFTRFKK